MENDTVVAITKPQLIQINRSLNDYRHIRLVNENLLKEVEYSDSISRYWHRTAVTTEEMYTLETQRSDVLLRRTEYLETEVLNEKKKSRKIGIGVGVGGTLLGVIIGALLVK